ncbi:MAG: NAD-dependent epimerase/dehydratase family protein [Bacillaceae bacterium]
MGKTVLITGVTGTLGGVVARRFLKEGYKVMVLIRNRDKVSLMEEQGFLPIYGDLSKKEEWERELIGIDFVIHCAAYLGDNKEQAVKANVIGTKHIASVAFEKGVKRLIHISTTSVFGEPNKGHFTEQSPIVYQHEETYIDTKAESERILQKYAEQGLAVTIIRAGAICNESNSYWGDRQVKRMLACDVVRWVHPEDIVPWVHGENLAEMIILATKKDKTKLEIYHGIDGNYPELDFRVKIAIGLGKEIIIPNRHKQIPTYSCDKIKTKLGYKPIKRFDETVERLIEMGSKDESRKNSLGRK